MRHERGFTLIELLIGLVMMLIVTAGIYKLLNTTQRLSRAQAERTDLQSNVRTAALVIPSELREINTVVGGIASKNDILDNQNTKIRYRAMRGIGFVCQATVKEIRLYRQTWSAYRDPAPGRDAAYVFVENQTSLASDDAWEQGTISGTSLANKCPSGVDAVTLTFVPDLLNVPVSGTPVRTFEVMELSLYANGGKSWLGAQSISGGELAPQPLLGPLLDAGAASGLTLDYLDANGNAGATKDATKSIVLTIRGTTTDMVPNGGGSAQMAYVQDSLKTQISLRNAFRP